MATNAENKPSPFPEPLTDAESNATSSESDSEPGDSPAYKVEWLATTRAKRSTAGNRMKSMLANEELVDEDSDLELLFQEDEDDVGFSDKEQDDGSDVHMESSEDEEENEAEAEDEGEKELQRKEREKKLAARKRKAQEAIPAKFRKKVRISQPDTPTSNATQAPKPRPKKKSERASWLPSATDLPTRSSERKTTRLSKEQLHHQMVEREERRKKQLEIMEKKAKKLEAMKKPPMTQAERLLEAAIVEKRNAKSLNRWEEAEKVREEERRAKLAALNNRRLEGPVVTMWSGIVDLSETQLKNIGKLVSIEEKPKRKRPSIAASTAANTAAPSPNAERPSTAVSAVGTTAAESPKADTTGPATALPTNMAQDAPSLPTVPETRQRSEGPKEESSGPTEPITAQQPSTSLPADTAPTPTPEPEPTPALTPTSIPLPPPSAAVSSPPASIPPRPVSAPRPENKSTGIYSPSMFAPLATACETPPPRPVSASPAAPTANASPISCPPHLPKPTPSKNLAPSIRSHPVKTEPQNTSQLPLALRPDIGPRFMPPPNPHFAQPQQSVLAPPVGMPSMLNGPLPILGYSAPNAPRPAGLAAPNASHSPSPLNPSSPAPSPSMPMPLPNSNSNPKTNSLTKFPSTFRPSTPKPSLIHTTASFQPIMPTTSPTLAAAPAKLPKKQKKEAQAGPKKTSSKASAPKKPPPPPEPPEPEPPLEGKVTRSCIILQNFDEEAIKKPEVQTQILFGRKMSKLAKPPHAPLCVITNRPARYRDPRTGLPFYNSHAFKEIQRLVAGDFKWSKLTGTWVGRGDDAAQGVPARFLRPETDEERKERLERREREEREARERKEHEEKLAEEEAKQVVSGAPEQSPAPKAPMAPMEVSADAQSLPATSGPGPVPNTVPAIATGPPPRPAGVPLMMPSPDDIRPAGPAQATLTKPSSAGTIPTPDDAVMDIDTTVAPAPTPGAEARQIEQTAQHGV